MTDIIDDDLMEMVARTIDADAWAAIEDGRDALPDSMWDVRRGFAIDKARAALAVAVPVIGERCATHLNQWALGADGQQERMAFWCAANSIRALTKGETG